MPIRSLLLLGVLPAISVSGVEVRRGLLSTDVNEQACSATKPATRFQNTDRQIFLAMTATRIAAGQTLQIEWVNPTGGVEQSTPYTDLPAAPSLCFITQLPVGGFAAAGQPGAWKIRVVAGDREIWSRPFEISGARSESSLRVDNVGRRSVDGGKLELTVTGSGFHPESILYIAEYRKDGGGWRYLDRLTPSAVSAGSLVARSNGPLPPAEYFVLVRNPDDSMSLPARLLIAIEGQYRFPIGGGERWIITQGPYGGFSHWRNSLHAYDLAPREGRWVTAMQAGTVLAHDLGMKQDHRRRTFGNYITIQHDNGEFSHYAHLASGTFQVRSGQRVEAGQPLARVGNSGYTLGEGGGYHLHVHLTRTPAVSSPSIPFKFDEISQFATTRVRGMEIRSNLPAVAENLRAPAGPGNGPAGRMTGVDQSLAGTVAVAQRWSGVLKVPPRAQAIETELVWEDNSRELDLHLVSPAGHHYGWYGDISGYSGKTSHPERFGISDPEPGQWLVMVSGVSGSGEPIGFKVNVAIHSKPAAQRLRARRR